jgi:hypothetical protein
MAYGIKRFKAALFWVRPGGGTVPFNPDELHEYLESVGTISQRDAHAVEKLLNDAAKYIIRQIRNDMRSGAIASLRSPALSSLTRTKKGHDTPLIESGQLAESLVVSQPNISNAPSGFSRGTGFAISVDTGVSPSKMHKPNYPRGEYINMVNLFIILTRTGALIDLSNPSVRNRVMGYLRKMGWLDSPEPRAGGAKEAIKSFIYIPPRPLFTQEYLEDLAQRAYKNVIEPRLGKALEVATKAVTYGPTTPHSKASWILQKWNALMQSMVAAGEIGHA